MTLATTGKKTLAIDRHHYLPSFGVLDDITQVIYALGQTKHWQRSVAGIILLLELRQTFTLEFAQLFTRWTRILHVQPPPARFLAGRHLACTTSGGYT